MTMPYIRVAKAKDWTIITDDGTKLVAVPENLRGQRELVRYVVEVDGVRAGYVSRRQGRWFAADVSDREVGEVDGLSVGMLTATGHLQSVA